MKIKWLGHASFLITSDKGLKIITDPYTVGGGIGYGKIQETADIVTVSHHHGDHDNVTSVKGRPEVLDAPGNKKEIKGIEFQGISSYHDDAGGKKRGPNTIFCFTIDGMKVCHMGDLGEQLNASQIKDIDEVDILLIPVGGTYTVDAWGAFKVYEDLKPKVVIPMHYKTDKCEYPIDGVDEFIRGRKNVQQIEGSEVEFRKDQLPEKTEIVVLKHAL